MTQLQKRTSARLQKRTSARYKSEQAPAYQKRPLPNLQLTATSKWETKQPTELVAQGIINARPSVRTERSVSDHRRLSRSHSQSMVGLYRASGQHETGRVRGSAGAGNVRGGARRSGGAPLRAYVLLSRETICEVEAGRFERRYATKTKLRHLREVQAEPTDCHRP